MLSKTHHNRAIASLTVPDGQESHFPHFFLKFRSISLIFPQTFLIFFPILILRVGESPTREGPGYATASQTLNERNKCQKIEIFLSAASYNLEISRR